MRGEKAIAALAVLLAGSWLPAEPGNWLAAAAQASRFAPQARMVVLDITTDRLLASSRLAEAARTLAAPGSALKPLVLYGLVSQGRWDPACRVACDRRLRIAGRALNCSHPRADPMDAAQALAWSCNSYFAAVGALLRPGELRGLLEPAGVLGLTSLAPAEGSAVFREPRNQDEARLTVLGVDGIAITPLELAEGYRWLARELAAHPESEAARAVRAGMEGSASFGTASAASIGGVPVMGKTGTAGPAAGGQTHGWFVGLAPADVPQVVVVVYLPAGRGLDAARVAAELLGHSPVRFVRP